MSRFGDIPGFEAVPSVVRQPTAEQIAATGDALPEGAHRLTDDQQRVWFGGVMFDGLVEWSGEAFLSGEERLTPEQVAARVRGGH